MDKEEEDTEEDKNDMVGRKDRKRNDHTQEEIGTAARRYSRRDHRLGVIPLPESVFQFIMFQEGGRMAEIYFRFPCIFQ